MKITQGHFANAIKEELLGGFTLECVECNYNSFEDKSIIGLVFMNNRTHEEKTLYFYDTEKVNYHIAKTNNIKVITA
jgi:hypothetical protein